MRHQATYSRAVFVCSGIYQGLGFRDLTEVREYVADACWRHRRRCGGTTFFWKDVFPWIYHGLSIEYLLYLCLFIHLFIYLLCCIIRMYSFASWDGTVGGLCLKCVCVCLLEPLQRQSESQSGNNLVVQFLPVDLGFLNLRQLWEKTLWSWCLAHVFSSGWRVLRVGRNRFRKSRDVSSCLSGHNKDMTKPQVFGHFPNPIRSIFVRGFSALQLAFT